MNKSRLGYLIIFAVLAGLLFFTSRSFLAVIITVLFIIGLAAGILLRLDAKRMQITLEVPGGAREGDALTLVFHVSKTGHLFAARNILIDLNMKNNMFHSSSIKRFSLQLHHRQMDFSVQIPASECGELILTASQVILEDVFHLFRIPLRIPQAVYSAVYPRNLSLQTILTDSAVGAPKDEGMLQNRKGNDPSEMFDIREYVPGDDIRAIHWKLSSKTEHLILREASEPTHYNIVILADFGLDQVESSDDGTEKVNFSIALVKALGEEFLHLGMNFCVAVPTKAGIKLFEIRDERDFSRMISEWLTFEIQPHSGIGLRYFMMNHMEQYFTKLLIVSAQTYHENIMPLEGRINTTVISAVSASAQFMHTKINLYANSFELPVPAKGQDDCEPYQIIC